MLIFRFLSTAFSSRFPELCRTAEITTDNRDIRRKSVEDKNQAFVLFTFSIRYSYMGFILEILLSSSVFIYNAISRNLTSVIIAIRLNLINLRTFFNLTYSEDCVKCLIFLSIMSASFNI